MRAEGPLAGRRIVNTRAPHQAGDFDAMLRAQGAEPLAYPCIDLAPPEDASALDGALRAAAAGAFDWLVLTSANTALALARRLADLGLEPAALAGMRVAAVGPATAQAAEQMLGVQVDLLPGEYVAEALAAALRDAPGSRVFLPQSALARPVLRDGLTQVGLDVTAVDAYRTVCGSGGEDIPALLRRGEIDAVTFTSSSTVRNFVRRLEAEGGDLRALGGVCIAAIGPVTAEAAADAGLAVDVVPGDHTLEGMVRDLADYYGHSGRTAPPGNEFPG